MTAFGQGARDLSPTLLGVVPFGVVAGLAAVEADLSVSHAIGFSVAMFAGAAQLVAIELLASDSQLVVIVTTALVVNLRLVMYSASIAPYLVNHRRRDRAVAAYFLVDQAYALSLIRYQRVDGEDLRIWYFLGCGVTLWLAWQAATVVGALAGNLVPDEVPLEFAVPLTFLAVLVPTVVDRPTLVAALVAAGVATSTSRLPANLGMPIGTSSGILVGTALAMHRRSR